LRHARDLPVPGGLPGASPGPHRLLPLGTRATPRRWRRQRRRPGADAGADRRRGHGRCGRGRRGEAARGRRDSRPARMSAPARDDPRAGIRPLALGALLLTLAGCTVGPNYARPGATVPDAYRGTTAGEATTLGATALGEQKWWEVFQDEQLRQLIAAALQQNWDVRVAAARVLQAQAQLGVTRADQFPSVTGGAQAERQRAAQAPFGPGVSFPAFQTSLYEAPLALA